MEMLLAAPLIAWDMALVPPLRFLIYDILAPLVFMTVLIAGFELAWPGSLRLRRMLTLLGALRIGDPPSFTEEPGFRTRCAVGGLVAASMWSLAITLWLAGYLHGVNGPSLAISQASPRHVLVFLFTLILGGALGYEWIDRMRRVRDAAASLAVIAVSMSVAGTVLFFYIVEPGLRDWFLALALGIVLGELTAAAQHPHLLQEGLFAALFVAPSLPAAPAEVDFPPADTVDADAWHADAQHNTSWAGSAEQDVWQPPPDYVNHGPRALIGVGSSSVSPPDEPADQHNDEGHAADDGEAAGDHHTSD